MKIPLSELIDSGIKCLLVGTPREKLLVWLILGGTAAVCALILWAIFK